jgi:chromosome segregation ATPase
MSSSPKSGGAEDESATVYSDISFMGRDTVAFSMGLRHSGNGLRKMPKSMASFLPNIAATAEEIEAAKNKEPTVSDEEAAQMMDDYDGCPEEHPDCDQREERWDHVEEVLRKEEIEMKALEQTLFKARAARDSARSQKELLRSRLEDKEDASLDLQTNIRKLKDNIEAAKVSAEEQHKLIRKLQSEIDNLNSIKKEQEDALANDDSNRSDRTNIVFPVRHHRNVTFESEVSALPDDPQEAWRKSQIHKKEQAKSTHLGR